MALGFGLVVEVGQVRLRPAAGPRTPAENARLSSLLTADACFLRCSRALTIFPAYKSFIRDHLTRYTIHPRVSPQNGGPHHLLENFPGQTMGSIDSVTSVLHHMAIPLRSIDTVTSAHHMAFALGNWTECMGSTETTQLRRRSASIALRIKQLTCAIWTICFSRASRRAGYRLQKRGMSNLLKERCSSLCSAASGQLL